MMTKKLVRIIKLGLDSEPAWEEDQQVPEKSGSMGLTREAEGDHTPSWAPALACLTS